MIGNLKDAKGRVLEQVRDTVKLAVNADQQITRKNVQYGATFTLPPGVYHVKFVVRENETGKLGSFETDVRVPDLAKAPLKMSSVVLASQHAPAPGKPGRNSSGNENPLIFGGEQYMPNLPHVFTRDQQLSFLYEVYEPGRYPKPAAGDTTPAGKASGMRVLTGIELLRGNVKVFASPLVTGTAINVPGRNAMAFAYAVPLGALADGVYTCQVNVIDDAGGAFSFPRTTLLVRGGAAVPAQTPASPQAAAAPQVPGGR